MSNLTQEIKNLIKCNDEHAKTLLDYHESLLSYENINTLGSIKYLTSRIRDQYRSLMSLQTALQGELNRITNPPVPVPAKSTDIIEKLDAKGEVIGLGPVGMRIETITFHNESKTFDEREYEQRRKSGIKGN